MKIELHGVVIREMQDSDLELVRNWRNKPEISMHMVSQDYISPERQKKWFEGIQQRNEKHFLVSYKGTHIGVYNLKNIDLENKSAEVGMYLADEYFQNTHVPYLVSLAAERIVADLGLQEISVFILDENKRAIRYNTSLGFRPTEIVVGKDLRKYKLDVKEYAKACEKLVKILKLD